MSVTNSKAFTRKIRLSEPVKNGIALGLGLYIGSGGIPEVVRGTLFLIFGAYCMFLALQNNVEKLFACLPYFIYNEIIIRANRTYVPNLYGEYVLLGCFILLILNKGTKFKVYSISFAFIFLYAIIELIDSIRTVEPDFARIAVVNSSLLLAVSLWSASSMVSVKQLNILMYNLRLASIFLTGNILVAHLSGNISYSTHSSFAATNSLAPVQVSGYLGLGTILLFFCIVNPAERKNLVLNIFLFTLSCVIMVLSFSRGGLYFLAATIMLYLLFNRKSMGSYFIVLMLIPVAFMVYYYVVDITGGLILDRYSQQGASGRDILVRIGFQIFQSDPLAGIGTGNFSKEIVARHLYEVESGAHNDFVRAAAEHGILGIVTYWGFYICIFFELIKQKGVFREFASYFFVLFILILIHNGLKIALQHLLLVFVIAKPIFPAMLKRKQHAVLPPSPQS